MNKRDGENDCVWRKASENGWGSLKVIEMRACKNELVCVRDSRDSVVSEHQSEFEWVKEKMRQWVGERLRLSTKFPAFNCLPLILFV